MLYVNNTKPIFVLTKIHQQMYEKFHMYIKEVEKNEGMVIKRIKGDFSQNLLL